MARMSPNQPRHSLHRIMLRCKPHNPDVHCAAATVVHCLLQNVLARASNPRCADRVQISLESLASRQQTTDEALSRLAQVHQAQQRENEKQQAHQQQTEHTQENDQKDRQRSGFKAAFRKPWYRKWPVVPAAYMVARLVGNSHPAYKAAQDLSLIYFFHKHCH